MLQRVVSQGLLPPAGWGCVCTGHEKVEVNPLVTFFVPGGGHTLFRRMQTARLMDCQSVCFPGFIFIREIVTQPLGEAEERAGLLFCSGLLSPGSRMRWRGSEFSCLGRALRRGGVNLQQQLSPLQTVRSNAGMCTKAIYGAIKNTDCWFLQSLIKYTLLTQVVCHQV